MHIKVKKGLDIPLAGGPDGEVQALPKPEEIALNLDPFATIRFKVLVKPGESVKIGQPLVESKAVPGQKFASPAAGIVKEIRRGLKRRLLDIVIAVDPKETFHQWEPLRHPTREQIIERLMEGGAFPYIRMRPFDLVADPQFTPRDIFVSAVESAPFVPSAEMQVKGHEQEFAAGLEALAKLTTGKVHLVHRRDSFAQIPHVEHHTVEGPHPAGTHSLHIQKIAPIQHSQDYVWTTTVEGVITIGSLLSKGTLHIDRILSVAGNGLVEGRAGFFRGRTGFPIAPLMADRLQNAPLRFISGDPLTGTQVEPRDFLSFYHHTFTVIPENTTRQLLHFFRPGFGKYTATRTYATGHMPAPTSGYSFTTNQHGEKRAFIDGAVYEKVMPLHIPTMHLIKALLSEDYEQAETLGLLEVAPEDFALPTFICPSKIEMIDIVRDGLHTYSKEMGH